MRRFLFSALLMTLLISTLAADYYYDEANNVYYNDDFLWFKSPEFMQPMFDSFSRNRLNTKAMGRGHIGVPVCEGIENALLNPAGFRVDGNDTYVEVSFKPEVEDYSDFYNYSEGFIGDDFYQRSELTIENRNSKIGSAYPSGIISYGKKLGSSANLGFSFSIPQSLDLSNYAHVSQAGEVYSFDTSLRQFDLTVSANYELPVDGLTVGLNTTMNIIDIASERKHFNYGQYDENVAYLSLMPGFLYKKDILTLGATFKTGTEQDFDMGFGEKYTVSIPPVIAGGIALETSKATLLGEINFEKTSDLNPGFDDRMIIKVGLEKKNNKTTFRVGFINMPEVFSGNYNLPMSDMPEYHSVDWLNDYNYGSIISNNATFITGGLTYEGKAFDLNGAFSADIGDTGATQISISALVRYDHIKKYLKK